MDTQTITTLLSLGIVSTLFSWGIAGVKKLLGLKGSATKAAVAILALVVGLGFHFLYDTSYWPTVVSIITISQVVYAFFLRE